MRKGLFAAGAALAFIALLSIEAPAQTSCAAFFNQCKARCPQWSKDPVAKCTADHCSPKLATCRSTGCWTEGPRFGGGKFCNLQK
jgi:hypothetical protein